MRLYISTGNRINSHDLSKRQEKCRGSHAYNPLALQNILEKSVRELGAIRRVDGAARVSLRRSSCNRCAWAHFDVNGLTCSGVSLVL